MYWLCTLASFHILPQKNHFKKQRHFTLIFQQVFLTLNYMF